MTDEKKKKPLTPIQKAERTVRFFKEKLASANSSTPNKHVHKWTRKLDAARDHLSQLTNGAV